MHALSTLTAGPRKFDWFETCKQPLEGFLLVYSIYCGYRTCVINAGSLMDCYNNSSHQAGNPHFISKDFLYAELLYTKLSKYQTLKIFK